MGKKLTGTEVTSVHKISSETNLFEDLPISTNPLVTFSGNILYVITWMENADVSRDQEKYWRYTLKNKKLTIQYEQPKPTPVNRELYIITIKEAPIHNHEHLLVVVNENFHRHKKIDEEPKRKTKIIILP